ncbi:hypothetical protein EV13_2076 [Prochlorococcus sp. MIT 0702]|nr:hypothetical protein EV13_2076 [Prochlorococcus sp. MIT 0702]KGG27731.1 hypothetical protein EV12_1162 [Prochlorococcus sp. MIT 0701]KGG31970.1 hypothetical protein EV14_2179 [Prochlorococcus sp. MIT 0703]
MIKKRFTTCLISSVLIDPGPVMSEAIDKQKGLTESSREGDAGTVGSTLH